uniref:40S ribosomal protein S27 n=1 Tax=Neogobius melanostomus TaxID=47308 RepID=A0A8C6SIN2_9GOBI
MSLARDLLHPICSEERRRHKKKRLVQCPNSYFMDVKCTGCYRITTIFSHSQTVVPCPGCSTVLCQPSGGKCRLTEGHYGSSIISIRILSLLSATESCFFPSFSQVVPLEENILNF